MDKTVKKTTIDGLLLIERPTYSDERGFFREVARISDIEDAIGAPFLVKQMNHAHSVKNTLRGIHAAPWNKLIYVNHGLVRSVIVDLRQESSTFGKHETFMLGEGNFSSVFIPKGCGNSYVVVSDDSDYTYLTDALWEEGKEITVKWDDSDLAIDWQIEGFPIVSDRDKLGKSLRELFPHKFVL